MRCTLGALDSGKRVSRADQMHVPDIANVLQLIYQAQNCLCSGQFFQEEQSRLKRSIIDSSTCGRLYVLLAGAPHWQVSQDTAAVTTRVCVCVRVCVCTHTHGEE